MYKRIVLLVLVLLAVSVRVKAADDPLVGTWKLNLAKSNFSPPPPLHDATIKYEHYGANGIKVTARSPMRKIRRQLLRTAATLMERTLP